MTTQAEQLIYWIVAPANRSWVARCQKLVANECTLEFRNKDTGKTLFSVVMSYDESAAIRQAMWWVEHIEPNPSTF